ncbi:MAG: YidH family protein [Vitreimonas sp.]
MSADTSKPYDQIQRDPRDPVQDEVPPVPAIDESDPERASLEMSKHRTKLSTHRTFLSEHRTGLSEHRTGLSEKRTGMSTRRTEMSSRRTGMSFQRTRMSADRTLMSVIRTSLSMIGFGFTIYQFFRGLAQSEVLGPSAARAAAFFGQALVYLGVGMVAVGILYHLQFMYSLRQERERMRVAGDVHGESPFPISLTLVVALLLLLLGIGAIAGIVFRLGPFG